MSATSSGSASWLVRAARRLHRLADVLEHVGAGGPRGHGDIGQHETGTHEPDNHEARRDDRATPMSAPAEAARDRWPAELQARIARHAPHLLTGGESVAAPSTAVDHDDTDLPATLPATLEPPGTQEFPARPAHEHVPAPATTPLTAGRSTSRRPAPPAPATDVGAAVTGRPRFRPASARVREQPPSRASGDARADHVTPDLGAVQRGSVRDESHGHARGPVPDTTGAAERRTRDAVSTAAGLGRRHARRDQISADQTSPDQTSPDQTSPRQTSPEQTSPEQSWPKAGDGVGHATRPAPVEPYSRRRASGHTAASVQADTRGRDASFASASSAMAPARPDASAQRGRGGRHVGGAETAASVDAADRQTRGIGSEEPHRGSWWITTARDAARTPQGDPPSGRYRSDGAHTPARSRIAPAPDEAAPVGRPRARDSAATASMALLTIDVADRWVPLPAPIDGPSVSSPSGNGSHADAEGVVLAGASTPLFGPAGSVAAVGASRPVLAGRWHADQEAR